MNSTLKLSSKAALATTPGRLRFYMSVIWVLAACFAVAGFFTVNGARNAADAIARKAVPSIITAQNIRVKMLEMDAAATQEFLAGGKSLGDSARVKYETARRELGEELTQAAKNISLGADEQRHIEVLMERVQAYSGSVEAARANNRNGYPVGAAYLRQASTILHQDMLPQVEAIDKANVQRLEQGYDGFKSASVWRLAVVAGSGLALLGVLVVCQLYISRRMQRTFNPALALASLMVLVLSVCSLVGLGLQRSNLADAREVGFIESYKWLDARGTVYDIKADETQYLIALGAGARFEQSLGEKSARLSKADLVAPVKLALSAYLQQDERIRGLDKTGKRGDAVSLALGDGNGEAVQAFASLDGAIVRSLEAARSGFAASVGRADANVRFLEWAFLLISVLAAVLAYFGITPRINEYRA